MTPSVRIEMLGTRPAVRCCGCDALVAKEDLKLGPDLCADCRDSARVADMRAIGDEMQSALSRLAEYVASPNSSGVPYEVVMACHEGRAAVDHWTELRKSEARR